MRVIGSYCSTVPWQMTGCSQYHMSGVAQLLMERECSLNKQETLRQVGKEKRVGSISVTSCVCLIKIKFSSSVCLYKVKVQSRGAWRPCRVTKAHDRSFIRCATQCASVYAIPASCYKVNHQSPSNHSQNQIMKPEMNVESGEAAAAAAVFYVPIEDNLLELPPAKATLTKFPPGVPILYTDTSIDPLEVSRGVVESVFIDLSPEKSTRDYFYRVSLQNVKTLMVGETQLQWAPGATVWMKPLQRKKDIEWEVGTVVGSYQETCNAEPEFSIRMGEKGFFHGVNGDCLRYRQPESDLPAMKTETIVASVLPQETSVLAEPKARSEGALESPTSVVDSLHTAIQQSLLSRTDPPPLTNSSLLQSIAAKNRALSQAKRLSPSNESLLSRTDPLPLANSSSPQSIAGKSRALSQAKRLSPSNEHVAEVNASASDFEDKHVPRPKKAKVVNAHSHEESKIDHNSIISKIPSQFSATPASIPMAYKTPSTKVSLDAPIPRKASVTGSRVNQGDPIHYGDYKESQVPAMTPIQPAYEHSQPVRNAADYASSVDSLEGNNCKVVIKVPSFANSIAVRGKAGCLLTDNI